MKLSIIAAINPHDGMSRRSAGNVGAVIAVERRLYAYSAINVAIRYVLPPGRYVGAEDVEEDGTPFPEHFAALQAKLEEQFAESARLTEVIRQRLADVIVPAE
jgi:hypothetical protein